MWHPEDRDNYLDDHRRNEPSPMSPDWTLMDWIAALDDFLSLAHP
jgi:hypothetical protein